MNTAKQIKCRMCLIAAKLEGITAKELSEIADAITIRNGNALCLEHFIKQEQSDSMLRAEP